MSLLNEFKCVIRAGQGKVMCGTQVRVISLHLSLPSLFIYLFFSFLQAFLEQVSRSCQRDLMQRAVPVRLLGVLACWGRDMW
jgi:hypothetical protein